MPHAALLAKRPVGSADTPPAGLNLSHALLSLLFLTFCGLHWLCSAGGALPIGSGALCPNALDLLCCPDFL